MAPCSGKSPQYLVEQFSLTGGEDKAGCVGDGLTGAAGRVVTDPPGLRSQQQTLPGHLGGGNEVGIFLTECQPLVGLRVVSDDDENHLGGN